MVENGIRSWRTIRDISLRQRSTPRELLLGCQIFRGRYVSRLPTNHVGSRRMTYPEKLSGVRGVSKKFFQQLLGDRHFLPLHKRTMTSKILGSPVPISHLIISALDTFAIAAHRSSWAVWTSSSAMDWRNCFGLAIPKPLSTKEV